MNPDLKGLLKFVKFTHEIRKVRRAIILEDDVRENDAEHCYQTALVAWYVIEHDNLQLDKFRCVGLAMIHDIAEAYAGDTIAFASKADLAAQKAREAQAILRIKKQWPDFPSLHDLIHEYESLITPESLFVYSLDKLMPILNNYLYEGKIWKKEQITLEMLKNIKQGKVDKSSVINNYYLKLLKLLENNPQLFGQRT